MVYVLLSPIQFIFFLIHKIFSYTDNLTKRKTHIFSPLMRILKIILNTARDEVLVTFNVHNIIFFILLK